MTGSRLLFTREPRRLGEQGTVDRRTLERIRRGVYADAVEWGPASYAAKYRLRLDAAVATRRAEPVLSHVSAAVVWGIPIVGPHLGAVHFASAGRNQARTKNGVVWHHDTLDDEDVVEHDGYQITSFARTAVDLARSLPFTSAVAALDHVLAVAAASDAGPLVGVDAPLLEKRLDGLRGGRGVGPARVPSPTSTGRSSTPSVSSTVSGST